MKKINQNKVEKKISKETKIKNFRKKIKSLHKELRGLTSYEIGVRINSKWEEAARIGGFSKKNRVNGLMDDILYAIYDCKCGCGKHLEMYDDDGDGIHYGCHDAPDHLTDKHVVSCLSY